MTFLWISQVQAVFAKSWKLEAAHVGLMRQNEQRKYLKFNDLRSVSGIYVRLYSGSRNTKLQRSLIEHDLLRLASIFYIDVAAFAVLSNHYHVVLHVDRECANSASAKVVVRRWHQLFKPNEVSQKFIDGEHLEPHERSQIDVLIDTWRKRLYDISWFMKVLNEKIARQANKEDECTGHFWEARYKLCSPFHE